MILEIRLWALARICRMLHGRPMHPINGVYRCRRCLRTWPVPWGPVPAPTPIAPHAPGRQARLLIERTPDMNRNHDWTTVLRHMVLILYGRRPKDAAAVVLLGVLGYGAIWLLFSIPD